MTPWPAIRSGSLYGALLFACGFAIGIVRTLWLAPRIGALAAVACELPIMLGAATVIVRWLAMPGTGRLLAAFTAFATLMACECGLAIAFGSTPAIWARELWTAPGALGLAGQIAASLLVLAPLRTTRQSASRRSS